MGVYISDSVTAIPRVIAEPGRGLLVLTPSAPTVRAGLFTPAGARLCVTLQDSSQFDTVVQTGRATAVAMRSKARLFGYYEAGGGC